MSVEPDHRKFRPQKPRFFCCHLNHVYTGAVMKALCAMLPEETEEQVRYKSVPAAIVQISAPVPAAEYLISIA